MLSMQNIEETKKQKKLFERYHNSARRVWGQVAILGTKQRRTRAMAPSFFHFWPEGKKWEEPIAVHCEQEQRGVPKSMALHPWFVIWKVQ